MRALFLSILILCPACRTPMPGIDVSFWAGDSTKDGISRAQDSKTMDCRDPEFDKYTCLTYEDVKKIFNTLLECKQWPAIATLDEMNWRRFSKENPEVVTHVLSRESESGEVEPVQR